MKKITKKQIGLWAGCVVSITLVLTLVPSILLEPNRDGILTKGYTHLLYSQGIQMSSLRIVVNPVLNDIYIDFWPNINGRTNWGLVGIVLPYKGTLGDNSGWHATPLKDSTVLVKEYECTDKNPCSNLRNPEYFIFNLADKIDSKSSSHHRVLFKFLYSAPTGEEYDYLLGLRQNNEQYELGFAKLENPKIMISLDKSAVNIKTDPPAEKPSSFSDKYLERIWPIEDEITYTTEYDMPSEKEAEERITSISSYVSLAIGVLGLIFTVHFREKGLLKQEIEKQLKTTLSLQIQRTDLVKSDSGYSGLIQFKLRNDGSIPARNVRVHYKDPTSALTLEQLIRDWEREIKNSYFPVEGIIASGSMTNIIQHQTPRDEYKEYSVAVWVRYDYDDIKDDEFIQIVNVNAQSNSLGALYDKKSIEDKRQELSNREGF